MNDSHVFLLVPGMCIAFLYCNYSEPHSQNRICDASFLLIEASSPKKFPKLCSFMQAWFANLCKFPRLWIVTKNRAYKFTPLGRIYIRGTTQIPYVKNENYYYIHDKTLNSRNEWGNVIPYQIHALCSRILPVCGSRGNFDSAWTSGSFSAGGLPSLSGK